MTAPREYLHSITLTNGVVQGVEFDAFALSDLPLTGNFTDVVHGDGTWAPAGGGAVASVSNSDGTLIISPTTGAVVAEINLAHANVWTAHNAFGANAAINSGSLLYPTSTFSDVVGVEEQVTNLTAAEFIEAGLFFLLLNPTADATADVYGTDIEIFTASGNAHNYANLFGIFEQVVHNGTGTVAIASGFQGNVNNNDAGTVTLAYGLFGTVQNVANGNVTTGYGFYGYVFQGGSGTITTAYGIYIDYSGGTGHTDVYGYYCADQAQTPSLGQNWNFYSQDTTGNSKNYFGGQVAIGAAAPSASAKLQVDSTTRGFLPPRLTTTQKNAVSSPAEGLVVHDSTLHAPYYWDGTAWTAIGGGAVARVTTTNATPTVALAVPVSTAQGVALFISVAATTAAHTDSAGGTLLASFYRAAGNVASAGTVVASVVKSAGLATIMMDVVANTGSQTADVTLTGLAGVTIHWEVQVRAVPVS